MLYIKFNVVSFDADDRDYCLVSCGECELFVSVFFDLQVGITYCALEDLL